MLETEARWIGMILQELDVEDLTPLLNVGSATGTFRKQVQPWIDREIFAPLLQRGVEVHHFDVQDGDGIDLRGDLNDELFMTDLASHRYRSLMCCNLLEHVANRAYVCNQLEQLVLPGGYLIVTVPCKFPYHPDPIDTLFRPNLEDIVSLFPGCRLIQGDILDCGTGWDYVDRDPRIMFAKVRRRIAGLQEHGGIKGTTSFLPWLFRQFRQTCTLLEKQSATHAN